MWVYFSDEDGRVETIFENLGDAKDPFLGQERYEGRVLLELIDPEFWRPGSKIQPMKDCCAFLKPEEVVLYKLKGLLPIDIEQKLNDAAKDSATRKNNGSKF